MSSPGHLNVRMHPLQSPFYTSNRRRPLDTRPTAPANTSTSNTGPTWPKSWKPADFIVFSTRTCWACMTSTRCWQHCARHRRCYIVSHFRPNVHILSFPSLLPTFLCVCDCGSNTNRLPITELAAATNSLSFSITASTICEEPLP
jgi:hypothetical protein